MQKMGLYLRRKQFSKLKATQDFREFKELQLEKQKHKCFYCKKLFCDIIIVRDINADIFPDLPPHIYDLDNYTIDHKIPLLRGGTNDYENLVLACLDCNCKKGSNIL